MIPGRRNGMLTNIPLIILHVRVDMMQLLLLPNRDPGMRWRDLGYSGREICHENTSSRLAGMKCDDILRLKTGSVSVHINTRGVSWLGGIKTYRPA